MAKDDKTEVKPKKPKSTFPTPTPPPEGAEMPMTAEERAIADRMTGPERPHPPGQT